MTEQATQQPTDIRVEHRPERPAVSIPIEVPMSQWDRANALVGELMEWMPEHQAQPVGPPFFQHRRVGDLDTPFDLSVGFELTAATDGDDRVRTDPMPAGRYLVGLHHGHPDRIVESHQALLTYGAEHGIHPRHGTDTGPMTFAGLYETYLTDPAQQPDLEQWQVEIAYLL